MEMSPIILSGLQEYNLKKKKKNLHTCLWNKKKSKFFKTSGHIFAHLQFGLVINGKYKAEIK